MSVTGNIKKNLILEILLFSVGVTLISALHARNLVLAFLLLVVWSVGIKFWHKKQDIVFFVVGGILGPLVEIIAVYFGAWQYTNPSFLGIPLWLPFAWGLGAVLIKRISETFLIFSKIHNKFK